MSQLVPGRTDYLEQGCRTQVLEGCGPACFGDLFLVVSVPLSEIIVHLTG